MNTRPLNIKELKTNPFYHRLKSFDLIDEIALRNLQIKEEYKRLRESKSLWDSIEVLSRKYHLSHDRIKSILFRPRKKKYFS